MRRLDIDTQDLSHLLPEQRKVLRFIAEAMGRANIPVYFCEDKDVPEDLTELGNAELLRFSDNLDEYLDTFVQADVQGEIFRVKITLYEHKDLKKKVYTYEVKDIELSSRPLAVKATLAKEGVHDNRGVSANRQASGKTDALTSSAGGRADAESRMSMAKVIIDSENKASNERISCEGIIKLSPATLLVETKLAEGLPGIEKGKLASGQTSGKTDVLTTSASGSANAICFISAAKLLNNIEKSYDPGKETQGVGTAFVRCTLSADA